jgi:hypothetical protein
MKFAGAMVSLFAIAMYAAGQQPPSDGAAKPAPSIGLEVGSKIPEDNPAVSHEVLARTK